MGQGSTSEDRLFAGQPLARTFVTPACCPLRTAWSAHNPILPLLLGLDQPTGPGTVAK